MDDILVVLDDGLVAFDVGSHSSQLDGLVVSQSYRIIDCLAAGGTSQF